MLRIYVPGKISKVDLGGGVLIRQSQLRSKAWRIICAGDRDLHHLRTGGGTKGIGIDRIECFADFLAVVQGIGFGRIEGIGPFSGQRIDRNAAISGVSIGRDRPDAGCFALIHVGIAQLAAGGHITRNVEARFDKGAGYLADIGPHHRAGVGAGKADCDSG